MEQIMMGVLVLLVVGSVKRKEIFTLRWNPDRGTWTALGTGLLAFLLSVLLLFLKDGSLAGKLVLYGGIWLVCGVVIPWSYVLFVEKRSSAGLGVRMEKLGRSLLISLSLAAFFSMVIIFQADLSALDWREAGRAAVVLIAAGGLFEAFLFYGFIHIRLEKAFGVLPAIFLTALVYVLWHAGTQLTMEADFWLGALKLLGVGIMYQSVFSLTCNLAVIWPLFLGMGVMIDFVVNIGDLQEISAQFQWGLGTFLAMAAAVFLLWLGGRNRVPVKGTVLPQTEAPSE